MIAAREIAGRALDAAGIGLVFIGAVQSAAGTQLARLSRRLDPPPYLPLTPPTWMVREVADKMRDERENE